MAARKEKADDFSPIVVGDLARLIRRGPRPDVGEQPFDLELMMADALRRYPEAIARFAE